MRRDLRVQLPEETHRRLLRLVGKLEASSYSEVVRRSLAAYEALLEHADEGGAIVLRGKDERTVVLA